MGSAIVSGDYQHIPVWCFGLVNESILTIKPFSVVKEEILEDLTTAIRNILMRKPI